MLLLFAATIRFTRVGLFQDYCSHFFHSVNGILFVNYYNNDQYVWTHKTFEYGFIAFCYINLFTYYCHDGFRGDLCVNRRRSYEKYQAAKRVLFLQHSDVDINSNIYYFVSLFSNSKLHCWRPRHGTAGILLMGYSIGYRLSVFRDFSFTNILPPTTEE